jgi:large subunit ribosomal protein L22
MTKKITVEGQAKAITKMMRVSPQKLNLVAQTIRGKKVEKAINELKFSRKRIALDVMKTLQSAIANAENNHELDVDELFVSEAYVGKNIVLKRWRARARGRVGKIQKPFSQLTIVVKENDKTEQIDITEEVQ